MACTRQALLQLVTALAVFVAPAAAAKGACSDIRCFNTVPEACCPTKYLDADALGATEEQVMTLPLEELQVGTLVGACSKNCSSIVFGLTPAFPNFLQSCLVTQGLFPSSLEQVYRSSGSLCSAYCAILAYTTSEQAGRDFQLTEIPRICSTGNGTVSCSGECRTILEVVEGDECRGRLAQVATYGLGPRIAAAYDVCGLSYSEDPPALGEEFVLANGGSGRAGGALAAAAAATLALLLLLA